MITKNDVLKKMIQTGKKMGRMRYAMVIVLFVFLFLYHFIYSILMQFCIREKFAKVLASVMVVVLTVSSINIAVFAGGDVPQNLSGSITGDVVWNDGDIVTGKIVVDGEANITVNGTVKMKAGITLASGNSLTITGGGTLKRDDTTNDMIRMSGGELTLDNIILDGASIENANRALYATGGTIIMNNGTTLKNHWKPSTSANGSAIGLSGGASFLMKGGTIQNCQSRNYGGAIILQNGASFTMDDGVVENNQTILENASYGGGAFYVRDATLTINGGRIRNNQSNVGGAIYNSSYGTTIINGGTFSGNTSNSGGFLYHSCKEGNTAILKISGAANIDTNNDIMLNSESADKYIEIISKLQYPIMLSVKNAVSGRIIAKGTDYQLTNNDMSKLQIDDSQFNLKLSTSDNKITLTESNVSVPIYLGYDANGGTDEPVGAMAMTTEGEKASFVITTSEPSYTGFEFLGWASSPSAASPTYQAGESIQINCNTTLYAVWEKTTDKTVEANPTSMKYTGAAFVPDIIVTDDGTKLTEDTDYSIKWPTDMVNVGEKTIIIEFKGSYSGSKTKKVNIIAATDNSITSFTAPDRIFGKSGSQPSAESVYGDPVYTYRTTEGGTYTQDNPTAVGDYYVKASVEATDNYNSCEQIKQFKIRYGTLSADELANAIALPDANLNGWHNQDIRIDAKGEWKLCETPEGTFGDSLTISEESEADGSSYTFYLKAANGGVYKNKLTYKLDKTKPINLQVKYGQSEYQEFTNQYKWSWFFKQDTLVQAGADDSLSGIAKYQYAISDTPLTDFSGIVWMDSISLSQNSKKYVYVKAIDAAGNETSVNYDGVVVYTDATQDTEVFTYIKNENQDKSVLVGLQGNQVQSIQKGNQELVKGIDYTVVSNGTITFKKEYLSTLSVSSTPYNFTIQYNPLGESFTAGEEPASTSIQLTVKEPQASPTPQISSTPPASPTPMASPTPLVSATPMASPTPQVSATPQVGNVTTNVEIAEGAPEGTVSGLTIDMAMKLLSEEERILLKQGENVLVYLEIKELEQPMSSNLKQRTIKILSGEDNAEIYFFDISMLKKVGNQKPEEIHLTGSDSITVSLKIPKKLQTNNGNRTYQVVRIHYTDGNPEIEVIPATYDEQNQTLTFKTNRFSIYGISYQDTAKKMVNKSLDKPANKEKKKAEKPLGTGDNSNPYLWFIIMLLSTLGMIGVGIHFIRQKRKQ